MSFDIFSGANLKVEFSTTSGSTASTDYKVIPEIASFVTSGFESTVIEVKSFNDSYSRKLLGSKSVGDIDIEVNWIPDDVTHMAMETAADSQKRCQVRITYYEDATHTTGYFIVYNVLVASITVSGDTNEVVKKTFKLAVDKGAVDKGTTPVTP
ncbi:MULTISPECIES: phage tail tube protein [Serratia]|uniref:phage tail tube protein n=1 Tax=Serratia TaxID=613 RepID=UPI0013DB6634|nr:MULTISPECIES: phage tail tube protein [Serratia]EHT9936645.1 hypothetical protein [Serratia marcescens]EIJ6676439.1 hypothetical protein [Serratia marcescens]MDP8601209.1 phage tail tube protein [Serratia marcescens]MDP8685909.1 phage tail tube protein [Serratia marcescens]MDP8794807.1 phage tail tube protein [Serratia marcescens]